MTEGLMWMVNWLCMVMLFSGLVILANQLRTSQQNADLQRAEIRTMLSEIYAIERTQMEAKR